MGRVKTNSRPKHFKMRIRIYSGGRVLGHGKAELLAHIDANGSLAEAAKAMGMSYMRAWNLVQELNSHPDSLMVELSRGSAKGKTGRLTPYGKKICDLYLRMEHASAATARPYARRLATLLK